MAMSGEDLRRKRERLGWTQVDLAKRLDVTTMTIKRYESGKIEIPRVVELALKQIEREEK
jgi:transcriptional regulator with XRE-family HTH domain